MSAVFTYSPEANVLDRIECFLIHLHSVYHNATKPDFPGYAQELDALKVPFWVQNNVSAIADEKPLLYRHSARHLATCACLFDWRNSGLRRDV